MFIILIFIAPTWGTTVLNDWCKGRNQDYQKVTVSSSFVYLIIDSVVAPHDKIDVSRQNIKTMHFTINNVHGNVISLHGAHVSWSIIFQS